MVIPVMIHKMITLYGGMSRNFQGERPKIQKLLKL